jgi:hypothetical protein
MPAIGCTSGIFATRFWRPMVGETGGSVGVDHSFAERIALGFGAEIMGRGKFGAQTVLWTDLGTDDEWRDWWGPLDPPFHTPVFVLAHHASPVDRDGGRHRLPLRRRLSAGSIRPRPGGRR